MQTRRGKHAKGEGVIDYEWTLVQSGGFLPKRETMLSIKLEPVKPSVIEISNIE